jgi:hypothetical protein
MIFYLFIAVLNIEEKKESRNKINKTRLITTTTRGGMIVRVKTH